MKEQVVPQRGEVGELGQPIRAAIVGAGYIADFHARAVRQLDGVQLVAVCDKNIQIAKDFGRVHGVPAYVSLEAMLEQQRVDVIHLLTPPDLHHPLAIAALQAGLHVFVEKPISTSTEEADDLIATSAAAKRLVRVNHNMTFSDAFVKLRNAIHEGELGPIDYACFNHFAELGPIRVGPFDSWMLREPGHAFFEIGSHLVSQLVDLIGIPQKISTEVDRESILPGGNVVFRRWRVKAGVGSTAVDLNVDLSPGFVQRTIHIRGLLGTGTVDLDANVCTIDRRTSLDIDFDRYRRSLVQATQIRSQAWATIGDYVLSKAKLRKRGNPYENTFFDNVKAFYFEVLTKVSDPRITSSRARDVVDVCSRVVAAAQLPPTRKPKQGSAPVTKQPNVLVLGGSGFIGRRLILKLLAEGHVVRVASRAASTALFEGLDKDRIEVARGDIRSAEDLNLILEGVEQVFHLATSAAKSWDQYRQNEIHPAQVLGQACLARGVRRLVYTGTIDSYYAGSKAGTITERTAFDPNISRRNSYARAKAAVEELLLAMNARDGLPLVIVRPGIVIGPGGNPFHWGIGKWLSEGVCQVWGDGCNKLPLVLVDDVACGLVKAMQVPGIEGRSYNLIDAPMLSARDYLQEFQRLAGMRVDIHYRSIWRFYLEDLLKWPVKKMVGHPDGERVPSYHDWESRTQKAHFDCSRARGELAWTPCGDRQRIITEGIAGAISAWLAVRN